MIEVKSLYKSFEDKEVLKDINSVFENGKTNLIIGQSGSGKTVLMKCIVGLFRPTSGEVLYDGRDLVTMNKQEWKMLRRTSIFVPSKDRCSTSPYLLRYKSP